MNDRYKKIDDFLKLWKQVCEENEQAQFGTKNGQNMIYHYFIRLGIKQNDRDKDVNNFFSYWISRFENKTNIKCFVDENWKYFCQFKNSSQMEKEYIKMYIPLDCEHLYEGANKIFDFLADNNIKHLSKIGKHIRFDNVVVRLTNKEDALKLAEFIKNDNFIQEGLNEPNPFAFSKDNIAYACDGKISYNTTVAACINIYIASRKLENKLNVVGYSDFYNFLTQYYNNIFINQNIDKFLSDFNIDYYNESEFYNYKQVLALIIKAAKQDFNFNDYLTHFETCKSKDNDNIDYLNINSNVNYEQRQVVTEDLENLLIEFIEIMSSKYGRNNALNSLENYLVTGKEEYITRTNNLRNRVVSANLKKDLQEKLDKSGLDIKNYINLLLQKYNFSDKESYLKFAMDQTYNKYKKLYQTGKVAINGTEWVISALKRLLIYNSYEGFTRDNNARDNLIKNVTDNDVLKILKEKYNTEIVNDNIIRLYITSLSNNKVY